MPTAPRTRLRKNRLNTIRTIKEIFNEFPNKSKIFISQINERAKRLEFYMNKRNFDYSKCNNRIYIKGEISKISLNNHYQKLPETRLNTKRKKMLKRIEVLVLKKMKIKLKNATECDFKHIQYIAKYIEYNLNKKLRSISKYDKYDNEVKLDKIITEMIKEKRKNYLINTKN